MNEKIDFVITWVDGNDPNWLNERNHYAQEELVEIDNSVIGSVIGRRYAIGFAG